MTTTTTTTTARQRQREMDAGIESLGAPSIEQPRGLLNE
ncbi:hypothetical protein ALC53_10904 [Atta colombica]|uniref:Uncharacterized protein n=1 Tax=Atta colombica TaxID=520822 RepID=A0A151I0A4_9HYME|nr:hypothetical protein ALC53_10904 [Atta colombica]